MKSCTSPRRFFYCESVTRKTHRKRRARSPKSHYPRKITRPPVSENRQARQSQGLSAIYLHITTFGLPRAKPRQSDHVDTVNMSIAGSLMASLSTVLRCLMSLYLFYVKTLRHHGWVMDRDALVRLEFSGSEEKQEGLNKGILLTNTVKALITSKNAEYCEKNQLNFISTL